MGLVQCSGSRRGTLSGMSVAKGSYLRALLYRVLKIYRDRPDIHDLLLLALREYYVVGRQPPDHCLD